MDAEAWVDALAFARCLVLVYEELVWAGQIKAERALPVHRGAEALLLPTLLDSDVVRLVHSEPPLGVASHFIAAVVVVVVVCATARMLT